MPAGAFEMSEAADWVVHSIEGDVHVVWDGDGGNTAYRAEPSQIQILPRGGKIRQGELDHMRDLVAAGVQKISQGAMAAYSTIYQVLITRSACRALTRVPRTVDEIEAVMAGGSWRRRAGHSASAMAPTRPTSWRSCSAGWGSQGSRRQKTKAVELRAPRSTSCRPRSAR